MVARPQPGGGHWAPAVGASGVCPPCVLAVAAAHISVTAWAMVHPFASLEAMTCGTTGLNNCAKLREGADVLGALWGNDFGPRPLACAARSGLVAAVVVSPSSLRRPAVARVGYA